MFNSRFDRSVTLQFSFITCLLFFFDNSVYLLLSNPLLIFAWTVLVITSIPLLESDVDDGRRLTDHKIEHERGGRRPKTRQNRHQKAFAQYTKKPTIFDGFWGSLLFMWAYTSCKIILFNFHHCLPYMNFQCCIVSLRGTRVLEYWFYGKVLINF